MVVVLCIIVSVVFTSIGLIFWDKCSTILEIADTLAILMAIIGWIATFVICFIALDNVIGLKGEIAANQEIYNALIYQLENNVYDNDNDIGKRELYEQITEWNSDLARGKAMQHDFWYGILYPDIYDNFEFIELDRNQ